MVRHYTEETSASIISTDSTFPITDINSLMSIHTTTTGQTNTNQGAYGHGDTEQDTPTPYVMHTDAIQAVSAVSTDYLDDFKPNKVIEYTVQPGDVISFIASDFGVNINSILWANKLSSPDNIKPGQVLKIPPVSGVIYTIQRGDTISIIAKKYGGDEAKIIAFNDLINGSHLDIGSDLIIPNGVLNIKKTDVKSGFTSSVTSVAKRFAYLVDLGDFFKIPTLGFNWRIVHGRNGVDIANTCGTPVYAAADGNTAVALSSGWNGGFGKYIKLLHPNGTETLYAHLNKLLVADGEIVVKGQKIGLIGTTGRSTGCHLHFEVHGARNPLAKY